MSLSCEGHLCVLGVLAREQILGTAEGPTILEYFLTRTIVFGGGDFIGQAAAGRVVGSGGRLQVVVGTEGGLAYWGLGYGALGAAASRH